MRKKRILIISAVLFILIFISSLYFTPELTSNNTNYSVVLKLNKLSYKIFKKNSALNNMSFALYALGDYKESSDYYSILLSKDKYMNSQGKDFRDLTYYYYMASLFNSNQKSKYIQEYDSYSKSYENEINMRISLIGIIRSSPNVEKTDFSYALTQYLKLIDHPNINENNNLFKVYGGMIKAYEEIGDMDSANKYRQEAKEYLEKMTSE